MQTIHVDFDLKCSIKTKKAETISDPACKYLGILINHFILNFFLRPARLTMPVLRRISVEGSGIVVSGSVNKLSK